MEQIDKLKEEFDKEFGPKTIWVVPSKENIETIKDIWSWIIQNFTPKEEVKKIDMKNKPMTPREEFEKLFEHVAYELDGNKYLALNLNLNPEEIWNWHISEMEKLLEKISDMANLIKETRKELGESQTVFGARFGLPHHSISYYENGHYEAPYSVIKFCIRQSLNKLKEEK